MMWGVAVVLFCSLAAQVESHEIVSCFPPVSDTSPSFLAGLNVELVTEGGQHMLNISWAVSIDASIEYLKGTRILISGKPTYLCEYHPHLAKANLTGSTQVDRIDNIFLCISVMVVCTFNIKNVFGVSLFIHTALGTDKMKVIFGVLAVLMILSSCCIIYKSCGANLAKSFGFKGLPASPVVPVPVLVVYPAENSVFQQAVVALTEFLQWHCGCSVAVDMWQQGKIAELGLMRWLAEQVKAADRVLIVCPRHSHSPSNHNFPQSSIPAAAHDLYPLILNMVASHAKNASELAKFWVVQLGEQQDKSPTNLPLELRACRTFCLMTSLNKLCQSLHTQKQEDMTIFNLFFNPGISYSEKSTVKLREAVEKLNKHQKSISRELEPLSSVVSSK
uniref:SEFIR domain-containing protein n=1 Tax=Mastacembelus armatus TaxID=205130 RepID=A0A3Q3SI99_9TELE